MKNSFYAMLSRMKYIGRWGLMRSTAPENLSEHTLETAYIAHALTVIGNVRLGSALDPGLAALYAMYHDCGEIITGDMPTPVKYGSEELRRAYKETERTAVRRLLDRLPEDMAAEYAGCFEIPGEYQQVIKAADKLSALIKCMEEQKLGNSEFDTAARSTMEKIKALGLPEADIFVEEFLPAYRLNLDEL